METGTWPTDLPDADHDLPSGRTLHRHAKSVTFDAAPPQINEYEMATPDLSSIGTNSREGSFESMEDDDDDDDMLYDPGHVDIQDDSFDASLEDTDKTPVVGPDDWRGDSPIARRGSGLQQYDSSPMPENAPSMASPGRPQAKRTDSTTSSGEHRPLPPLPSFSEHAQNKSATASPISTGLATTAERMLGAQRNLPLPPPASTTSKSDIQSIGTNKMSLEERLKLMMLSDDNDGKTAAEQQRERRLRRCNGRERLGSPTTSEPESLRSALEADEEDDTIGDISGLDEYHLPPRISRESIMRRVNGNKSTEEGSEYNFSSPPPASRSPTKSPERLLPLDPDIPIPSTEHDSILDEVSEDEEGSVIITRPLEEDDSDDVLDFYGDSDPEDEQGQDEEEKALPQLPSRDTDSSSHYSEQESVKQDSVKAESVKAESAKAETPMEIIEEPTTPRATTPTPTKETSLKGSLPDFGPSSSEGSFSKDFESYMISEPEEIKEPEPEPKKAPEPEPEAPKLSDARAYLQRPYTPEQQLMSKPEYDGTGWGEPSDESDEEPGTPESVIRHPMPHEEDDIEPQEPLESPAIPERKATIKATGGSKLKTRVSNTPSDLAAMREARRQVSVEIPDVPAIPDRHRNRLSLNRNADLLLTGDDFLDRHPSFKNRSLTLDLDLGLSLDQDFERVIEAQKVAFDNSFLQRSLVDNDTPSRQASTKFTQPESQVLNANITSRKQRGYLMRQNTKLVTASDKDADGSIGYRSAGNSPVKMERPQSWTVEPWNGKPRPRSTRKRGGMSMGPIPPMPGYESNALAMNQVVEEDYSLDMATADSGERGRLFVKVMGVKDLDLPIPRSKFLLSFGTRL